MPVPLMLVEVPAGRIPPPVLELCRRLRDAGFRAWVVGGCLRDLLAGRAVSDWDVCTSALPAQVQRTFRRVIPTGIEHGTVTVLLEGTPYEVTTLRGEGAYTDGRRPDSVHFVDDIDQDLARRDFTVNAIAYDPLDDRLVDPFRGREDMARRVLRAVGDAHERFSEDGLRVLRAARFVATLEFELDEATAAAIPATLDTFRKVSPERVRDEWLKTMKARRPSRAFRVMASTGILGVTYPELAAQIGCTQNKWHAFDVWGHSLETLDALEGDPVLRLAGLLHDIGKPRTRALGEKTQDYTFYNHEAVGAQMADAWLRAFRFSNEERDRVVHLIRHHLVCYADTWSDAAVRRFLKRVGPERVADLLRLAQADALGKGRPVDAELAGLVELQGRIDAIVASGSALSTRDLAVNGADVMKRLGIRPSRRVGEVLEQLLERVLEEPSLNDRDALFALVDVLGPGESPPKRGSEGDA
jgi:tRNA nucleotidyltransferase (CCA-adding enzyme)